MLIAKNKTNYKKLQTKLNIEKIIKVNGTKAQIKRKLDKNDIKFLSLAKIRKKNLFKNQVKDLFLFRRIKNFNKNTIIKLHSSQIFFRNMHSQ